MPEYLLDRHGLYTMDLDLKKLNNPQTERPDDTENFQPCIISKTDIIFFNDELLLLSAGLKYNLNHNTKIGLELSLKGWNSNKPITHFRTRTYMLSSST